MSNQFATLHTVDTDQLLLMVGPADEGPAGFILLVQTTHNDTLIKMGGYFSSKEMALDQMNRIEPADVPNILTAMHEAIESPEALLANQDYLDQILFGLLSRRSQ